MSELHWAQPTPCRCCRYPTGEGGDICPNCGTPLVFFSLATLKSFLSTSVRWTVYAVLMGAGLYLCYTISPLLLLLPIACVFNQNSGK